MITAQELVNYLNLNNKEAFESWDIPQTVFYWYQGKPVDAVYLHEDGEHILVNEKVLTVEEVISNVVVTEV